MCAKCKDDPKVMQIKVVVPHTGGEEVLKWETKVRNRFYHFIGITAYRQ